MRERVKVWAIGLGFCLLGVGGLALVAKVLLDGEFERFGRVYTLEDGPVVFVLHMGLMALGACFSLFVGGLALWSRPGPVRPIGAMGARIERRLNPEPLRSHPSEPGGPDGPASGSASRR